MPVPQPPPVGAQPAVGAQPPVGAQPLKTANRRTRLILAMVAGVAALLCLGGVGVFVSLYDDATKIKRSEPDAVVDSFLGAYFVTRDEKEVELYTCKPTPDLIALAQFRGDLESREKRFSIGINVTWRNFAMQTEARNATVGVDLVRTITDGSEETSDRWQFQLVDDGGWRVCGATQSGP